MSPDCPLAVPSLLPKYFLTFPSFFLHCMFIIPSRIFMLSSFDAFADFLCPPLYWLVMCGVQLCGREALGVIKDSLTVSILCVCLIDSVIINPECSVGGAWRAPFFPINEASFLTRGSSSSWYHRVRVLQKGSFFSFGIHAVTAWRSLLGNKKIMRSYRQLSPLNICLTFSSVSCFGAYAKLALHDFFFMFQIIKQS